jgi:hypothetical protein
MEEAMGRLRYSDKTVSKIVNASRAPASAANAGREERGVWREAREMRDEWRRNRYARLLENGADGISAVRHDSPATRIA